MSNTVIVEKDTEDIFNYIIKPVTTSKASYKDVKINPC